MTEVFQANVFLLSPGVPKAMWLKCTSIGAAWEFEALWHLRIFSDLRKRNFGRALAFHRLSHGPGA
jgi:hypothetical protein